MKLCKKIGMALPVIGAIHINSMSCDRPGSISGTVSIGAKTQCSVLNATHPVTMLWPDRLYTLLVLSWTAAPRQTYPSTKYPTPSSSPTSSIWPNQRRR